MATLYHKKINSVSYCGEQYAAKDGYFDVPDCAVPDLVACFGFEEVGTGPETGTEKPLNRMSAEELRAKAADLGVDAEGMNKNALLSAVSKKMKETQ